MVESSRTTPFVENERLNRNNQGADIRAAEVARATGKHLIWGVSAEYETPELLIAAAKKARLAGYTKMDGYTPMPVEGLSEAIGFKNKQMPALMLLGGILGGTSAYFMQWFANTQSYVLNLGGRPYHTWPNFIVITFEGTILLSALTGVFGMIILNGLPTLYHPIFNAPNFEAASQDKFFLAIEARDPKFEIGEVMALLNETGATNVAAVEK